MGFRFRKSVKVAPGVRLNVGKKGVSATVGGKKGRVNVSSRGTSVGASIPGTGVSYNKRIGSKKSGSQRNEEKEQEKQQRHEQDQVAVEQYEAHVQMLTSLHQEGAEPVNWHEMAESDPPFQKGEEGPHARKQREKLENYQPTFRDRLFNRSDARKQILRAGIKNARKKDQGLYDKWLEDIKKAEDILQGDRKAWHAALTNLNSFNSLEELGNEVKISFPENESKAVAVMRIKDHTIVPATSLSITKTGKLSEKKMTKENYYQLYKNYVCSCVFKIARELVAVLPVEEIAIHVYDQSTAEDTSNDGCILSVNMSRSELEQVNIEHMDCWETLQTFTHHVKFLKTRGFKFVEELDDK